MDRQLKKGLLEYCVLTAICKNDSYGYKIIEEMSPYVDISESTLYPILRRLEASGKIQSYNTEYNNRIRKYYSITVEGIKKLNDFKKDRVELLRVLAFIAGGNIHEQTGILEKTEL